MVTDQTTVLVVDDIPANADLLRRWLSAEGYNVVSADTGQAALAAAREHRPGLVLLDIMIPSPSGFEVCRQIKTDPTTRHARVVLMSGLQHPENWRHGREVGADDFLPKPLRSSDVLDKVHALLGDRKP